MNTQNLIKKSAIFQKQAKNMVNDTKISSILSKLGKVYFVGSYKLGLMMRRDIDIIVINPKPSGTKAKIITEELRSSKKFLSVKMVDGYTKKLPHAPRGYYWELKIKKPEGVWKFDVWYLARKEDESIAPIKKWKKLLTSANKELILEVKNKYLKTPMLYSHGLYGAKIYRAVLERGIKDKKIFHKRIASSTRDRQ